MAKVSYVPYDQDVADFFAMCGITLTPENFGGNQGWYAPAYAAACAQAEDYLNEHMDEFGEEELENYFNMLSNYNVFYWSTESYIPR